MIPLRDLTLLFVEVCWFSVYYDASKFALLFENLHLSFCRSMSSYAMIFLSMKQWVVCNSSLTCERFRRCISGSHIFTGTDVPVEILIYIPWCSGHGN
jgi:hypothetical protein